MLITACLVRSISPLIDLSRQASTRGAIAMVLAMAAFAIEDMLVKHASVTLPIGQILIVFGVIGSVFFMGWARVRSEPIFPPGIVSRALVIRSVCEVAARLFFTLSLALTSLSGTSAILQATPLVVMVGAVVFFGERVGYRRWIATLVGLLGVLLIIKPGANSFEPASLFAVAATLGFAGRDLGTRAAPQSLSGIQLGIYGFIMLVIAGLVSMVWQPQWVWPDALGWLLLFMISTFGIAAYYALTIAMRSGEMSLVAPFRYTRLVFAIILGFLIFSEVPDIYMLIGSVLIVCSGLFSFGRADTRKRAA